MLRRLDRRPETPALACAIVGAPFPASRSGRARLEKMFRDHHKAVWRMLCRFGLAPADAADVGQEAYLVAGRRLDDIRLGSELAFLIGAAVRIARNHRRKAHRLRLEDDMDLTHAVSTGGKDGSDLQLLDVALSQVDPDLVEVFVLYELEGFTASEIAEALELPAGTVASRLRRAREAFQAVVQRIKMVMTREGRSP